MPTDKIRPPQEFPQAFHDTLSNGQGMFLIELAESKKKALAIARKYRAFIRSIRAYPLHPHNELLTLCDVRTRVKQLANGTFTVYAIVNRKIHWEGCQIPVAK